MVTNKRNRPSCCFGLAWSWSVGAMISVSLARQGYKNTRGDHAGLCQCSFNACGRIQTRQAESTRFVERLTSGTPMRRLASMKFSTLRRHLARESFGWIEREREGGWMQVGNRISGTYDCLRGNVNTLHRAWPDLVDEVAEDNTVAERERQIIG